MAKHALLVGVSQFTDPNLSCLNAPASDVEALADILRDPARGRFDQVVTSLDDDLQTIRDKLAGLFEERRPRDSLLLYYSGHGINIGNNQLFLATGTTQESKPRARSLPATEIRDMMADSLAGQLIVILDCCHSGAFMEGAKGAVAPVSEQTFSAADGAEGQYVLMACNAMQVSLDGTAGPDGRAVLSRFTSWLVEGLRDGGAAPDKPEVTLDDLYGYLCRRAREAGALMTPQRFVRRNAGELVIAVNPRALAPALPEDVQTGLQSGDWAVRLQAAKSLLLLARDDRLRLLVREAATARLAQERDREVSEALEDVVSALRLRRLATGDHPPEVARVIPAAVAPDVQPRSAPDPVPPPRKLPNTAPLTPRQARVVVNTGITLSELSAAGRSIFDDRVAILRRSDRYWWSSLACIVVIPSLLGYARYGMGAPPGIYVGYASCLVLSLMGLFAKAPAEPIRPENAQDTLLVGSMRLVRFIYIYERTSFRRSCWLLLVVCIVSSILLLPSPQTPGVH